MPARDPDKIQRNPSGRSPNQTLQEITAEVKPVEGRLSLVHVTSAGYASRIFLDGQIVTKKCEVFDKHLVYLFLCQASYRRKGWEQNSDSLAMFPVAFILDPTKIGNPHQIYPFDTGAAVNGIYTNAHADGVYLEDFALSQDFDSVRKFIAWAFGSLDAYLHRKLKDPEQLSELYQQWQFVPAQFIHIARQAAPGHNEHPDGRAASIEVAYNKHLPLDGTVRCVIVPDAFLENTKTKEHNPILAEFLVKSGASIKVYKWHPGNAPSWHMAEVERLCREALGN
jgi:CRISPR/Cas system-associated protein endoribonuclease Cas2